MELQTVEKGIVAKTRHIQKRMSQRGITNELLSMALDFGVQSGDKAILNSKAARAFLEEIEQIKRKMQKIVDKGGLVVVAPEKALITAYDLDSYRRQRRS